MPSKRQQQQQYQRTHHDSISGHGALSLDLKPPQQPPLPPPGPGPIHYHDQFPSFPTGFSTSSSSAASSVIGTPQQQLPRPESPDLALLGAVLPTVDPPFPSPSMQQDDPREKRTLGDKTFGANAEMPQWMQEVTSGFAKEVSQLMHEMEELRKQKSALQLEIANLMGTLSQYSPGGQFAPQQPHWSQSTRNTSPESERPSPPSTDTGKSSPVVAKPGWRTVQPEPKKIRSTVVAPPAPKPHTATLPAPSPNRAGGGGGGYTMRSGGAGAGVDVPGRPTWSHWQASSMGVRQLPMKPMPPVMPTLFGE